MFKVIVSVRRHQLKKLMKQVLRLIIWMSLLHMHAN